MFIALTVARTDAASYLRGKLFMAGVHADTPLTTALDVIQVLLMEVPNEELEKWRRRFDSALWKIRPPDRETWGLLPDQVASTQRLIHNSPG